jgi:hypothetical protein
MSEEFRSKEFWQTEEKCRDRKGFRKIKVYKIYIFILTMDNSANNSI